MLDRHYHLTVTPPALSQETSDLESIYLKAADLRDFEISQLVQRNNFFMIFQGVLLAGVLQTEGNVPAVASIVCVLGALMSVAQYRMAAGAKYWQQRWETEVVETEDALREAYERCGREWARDLFTRVDSDKKVKAGLAGSGWLARLTVDKVILDKPSVSRIPIYSGMILCAAWLSIGAVFVVRGWSA